MIKKDCGDVAISRSSVFEGLKLFGEDIHTGRPSTIKIGKNVSGGQIYHNSDRKMRVKMIIDDSHLPQIQAFEIVIE